MKIISLINDHSAYEQTQVAYTAIGGLLERLSVSDALVLITVYPKEGVELPLDYYDITEHSTL